MAFFAQENLTATEFLRDYWQRKPLLLRQAFPDFQPLLSGEDIAGLACDELAESRLITGNLAQQNWELRHGPFEEADFTSLPPRDWTLLVQDVEKHYPPLQSLLAAFAFLPQWRIDDLMVSVAGPGGSVGPHLDQYDVFLLQATGSRRWEIAEHCDPELLPGCELNILQNFSAERQWVLEPGDMLYLPPGVAHHGIALESGAPSMTWSIGMRAPSAADLLLALGEWLAMTADEGGRYSDRQLTPPPRCGEIDSAAIRDLRTLARAVIDDHERFPMFLGAFISRYRLAHEPAPPEEAWTEAELRDALENGSRLKHNPWTRLAWLATPDGALLFAAGDCWRCSPELAASLCAPEALQTAPTRLLRSALPLLCELVNRGHLVVEPL